MMSTRNKLRKHDKVRTVCIIPTMGRLIYQCERLAAPFQSKYVSNYFNGFCLPCFQPPNVIIFRQTISALDTARMFYQ